MTTADPTAASSRTLDILVVEDSTTQALMLRHILEQNRHRVSAARDGLEALERITAQPPDLVITDVNMPNMDGYTLCRRIKEDEQLRQVPVILLTALSDPRDILRGLECGADSFIVKPYEEKFLMSRIESVVTNRELLQKNGGSEIFFAGERYHLATGRTHSIDLLLSTYETAVQKNLELSKAKEEIEHKAGELREKNAQLEADLDMARELQKAFLPQRYPVFPAGTPEAESALGFCHRYSTTTELGGDFFDVFPVSATEAGIFICDVMGHGVRAALVTAIIRGLVEELSPVSADPARFVTEMNTSLCDILHQTVTPLFASAFYCVIDVTTAELRHANAGHPFPLLLSRTKDGAERLLPASGKCGPALGVFPGSQYKSGSRKLDAGDFLVLFTDGLYEVESPEGEMRTQESLATDLAEIRGLAPCAILDELIRRMLASSATGKFEDDVCLVGVEFRGTR